MESSETPVLYTGRTVPKSKDRCLQRLFEAFLAGASWTKSKNTNI